MSTLQADRKALSAAEQLSPAPIFETLNRYQHTMALKGAIDLDLFTNVGPDGSTADEIALRCQASARGTRILCDYLTIIGFLEKTGNAYRLPPVSAAFLNKKSPVYAGSIAHFMAAPSIIAKFSDVAALVRNGGALEDADLMKPENPQWVHFARTMQPVVGFAAQLVAPKVSQVDRKEKVLDIAAGPGLFGISIALVNPKAEIVALDWKNVLEVSKENAVRAGVQERFRTLPGDALEADLGTGYDVVLVPNFLHHFDVQTIVRFLKRVRAVMNPGGRLATVEFVPNDDRVTPPTAAAFSLTMLGNTKRGDAYTFRELDQMFRSAGFGESQQYALLPTPLTLLVTSV